MLWERTRAIRRFANDEFISVALPRTLVIKNARLGVLFKSLQVVFFLVMITYFVTNEVWRRASPAKGWATVIWSGGHSDGKASSPDAAYCMDPVEYHYSSSRGWSLRPQGCRNLSNEEAALKGPSEDQLFVTTFVRDTSTWQGMGAACNEITRLWCEGDIAVRGLYNASAGGCSCSKQEDYFVQNAEDLDIFFSHGYEVDTSDGRGLFVMQGSSSSLSVLEGPRGQMEERTARMVTVLQRDDGTPCEVGGRRSWENDDARIGISGTLGEFLACAGVTLDTNPRSIMPAGGLAPHLRTMGVSLELQLHYTHNLYDTGTSCTVRVRATPLWSWRHLRDSIQLPGVGGNHEVLQHSRYNHGVAISMKVSGQFYTFDIVKLVTAFTSLLVILQLPRYITQFIALYCLGLTSEIYRNAKRARLNIFEHFHGAVARMLLAEIGFRGLLGGVWGGKIKTLGGLTESLLLTHVKDAFHQQIQQGILQMGEVRRMVHIIFKNMDVGKTGTVDCGDFIHSCTANDPIDIHSMARFFDDDKKVGWMQGYLDNTDRVRREFTTGSLSFHHEDEQRSTTESPRQADTPESQDTEDCSVVVRASSQVPDVFSAGPLEADDVRIILGEGLEPLHARVHKLEALDLPHQLADLEQRVARAVDRAERAAHTANRAVKDLRQGRLDVRPPEPLQREKHKEGTSLPNSPRSTGKDAARPRGRTASPSGDASIQLSQWAAPQEREFLLQVPSLSSRLQQVEDTINLMQANLEARTAELEAAVFREASQDLQSDSLRLCHCLEERMKRLEAELRPEGKDGNNRLDMPLQQPSMVSTILNFFPAGRRAQDPIKEVAPAEAASKDTPSCNLPIPLQGKESLHPCDPILVRSLNQSHSNTPMHIERDVTARGVLATLAPMGS